MTDIAVILSHERSGSHLLGYALGSHPDVCYIDELTRYIRARNLTRFQSAGDVREFLLGIQRSRCPDSLLLVDVKYGMVRFNREPLEEFLRQSTTIHLYRTDYRAWWYSRQHAEVRRWRKSAEYADGVERTEIKERPPAPKIVWNQMYFRQAVQHLRAQQNHFAWLATYSLTYEDLTKGREVKVLPAREARLLCSILGIPNLPLRAQTRKMSPDDFERYWR